EVVLVGNTPEVEAPIPHVADGVLALVPEPRGAPPLEVDRKGRVVALREPDHRLPGFEGQPFRPAEAPPHAFGHATQGVLRGRADEIGRASCRERVWSSVGAE